MVDAKYRLRKRTGPTRHNISQADRPSIAGGGLLFVRYISPVVLRSKCDATLSNKAAARSGFATHAR
jgi:hypothetical protein